MEPTVANMASSSNPNFLNFQGTATETQDLVESYEFTDFEFLKNRTVFIEDFYAPSNEGQLVNSMHSRKVTTFIDGGVNLDLGFLMQLKMREVNDENASINFLYEHVNPLLDSDCYFRVDSLISFFILFEFKLKLTIAFLTITNGRKVSLSKRTDLLEYGRNLAKKMGMSDDNIKNILSGF